MECTIILFFVTDTDFQKKKKQKCHTLRGLGYNRTFVDLFSFNHEVRTEISCQFSRVEGSYEIASELLTHKISFCLEKGVVIKVLNDTELLRVARS